MKEKMTKRWCEIDLMKINLGRNVILQNTLTLYSVAFKTTVKGA